MSGMSFLNVGSGTGYFSTLAGYIIKKDGINHGVELQEDLVKFANERVREFLENGPSDCKDICTPVFLCGNACRLDPDQMKYDRYKYILYIKLVLNTQFSYVSVFISLRFHKESLVQKGGVSITPFLFVFISSM